MRPGPSQQALAIKIVLHASVSISDVTVSDVAIPTKEAKKPCQPKQTQPPPVPVVIVSVDRNGSVRVWNWLRNVWNWLCRNWWWNVRNWLLNVWSWLLSVQYASGAGQHKSSAKQGNQ
jgi:hypothetical protein